MKTMKDTLHNKISKVLLVADARFNGAAGASYHLAFNLDCVLKKTLNSDDYERLIKEIEKRSFGV